MPIGLLFLLKNDEEEGFFKKNYFVFKIRKKVISILFETQRQAETFHPLV